MPSSLRSQTSEKPAVGSMRWGEFSTIVSTLKKQSIVIILWIIRDPSEIWMGTQTSLVFNPSSGIDPCSWVSVSAPWPDMSVAHIYRMVVFCPPQLLFVSPLTENVPVEGSVTSCTWSRSLENWGESSMAAGRKGKTHHVLCTCCPGSQLVMLTNPFPPQRPSQVSLKG